MKSTVRQLFPGVALALFLTFPLIALAQEAPKSDEKSTPATPAVPAATPAPAASETPAAPAAAEAPITVELEKKAGAEPTLRRIDEPVSEASNNPAQGFRQRRSSGDFPIGDHLIASGSQVFEVVSVMGSSTVEGKVDRDAVSIGGDTTVGPLGRVGGVAVAVLGQVNVQGSVANDAVSVLGGIKIDGHVAHEVVSVLGDLELGPNAVVDGDIVMVGGRLTKQPGAMVHGDEVNVPLMGHVGSVEWLVTWIKHCAMFGRMLGFDSRLGWAWAVALGFIAFYVALTLLFRRGIDRCVQTLVTRPGKSILASILLILLVPVATVLLCVSVVGIPVVPFFIVAIICASLFGKAVMLACIGRPFTRLFGDGPLGHTALAVLVGGVLVLMIYTVPVLGMLTFKLLGSLGLGVVVYTVMLASRREKPPVVLPQPVAPVAPVTPPLASNPTPLPAQSMGFGGTSVVTQTIPTGSPHAQNEIPTLAAMSPGVEPAPASIPPTLPIPARPSKVMAVPAATLPRAGFWLRLGAMVLDIVLVGIVCKMSGDFISDTFKYLPHDLRIHSPPSLLPWLAIYGAVMWKLKSTTIGGIVCGLKVVRIDGREIDWATAIVRALGCFLSLVVAGLGFIWVVFDEDKQSWHDKIAGTTVVRLPKGTPLV